MNKIVVTGFQPFDRFAVNPSWQVAKRLKAERSEMVIKELTVNYRVAHEELTALLETHPCDTLLMMGLADRGMLKLETIAWKPPQLAHIEGPALLRGHWNWQENIRALHAQNLTAVLSSDAGSYVCESTYWSALNFRANHHYPRSIAFLHVPLTDAYWTLESLLHAASLSLDAQVVRFV